LLVRPVAADRTEHVSPEDPSADVLETTRHDVVVDAGLATILADHLLEDARVPDPIVQRSAPAPERFFEVSVQTGTVTSE
jgi:hypothetical protein